MDGFLTALQKVGGFAVIGMLIDSLMRRSEKVKLEHMLIVWWFAVDNVKWTNFGQKEAQYAISILDRWAGKELWSWKRWRFASLVTIGAYGFAAFITSLRFVVLAPQIYGVLHQRTEAGRYPILEFTWSNIYIHVIPEICLTILAFAVSLSLTRLIAETATELSRGRISTFVTFVGLLAVHIAIAIVWTTVVVTWFVSVAGIALSCISNPYCRGYVFSEFVISIINAVPHLSDPLGRFSDYALLPIRESVVPGNMSTVPYHVYRMTNGAFQLLMNIMANGIRILFAVAFVISFIFRPAIQEPIQRILESIINEKRPVFTVFFGAIGAIVTLAQALS